MWMMSGDSDGHDTRVLLLSTVVFCSFSSGVDAGGKRLRGVCVFVLPSGYSSDTYICACSLGVLATLRLRKSSWSCAMERRNLEDCSTTTLK